MDGVVETFFEIMENRNYDIDFCGLLVRNFRELTVRAEYVAPRSLSFGFLTEGTLLTASDTFGSTSENVDDVDKSAAREFLDEEVGWGD